MLFPASEAVPDHIRRPAEKAFFDRIGDNLHKNMDFNLLQRFHPTKCPPRLNCRVREEARQKPLRGWDRGGFRLFMGCRIVTLTESGNRLLICHCNFREANLIVGR